MQQKASALPSVPAYVAFTLVIGSFMLGHYSQQAHNIQTALKGEAPEQVGMGRHLRRRELHMGVVVKQTSQEAAQSQHQLVPAGAHTALLPRRSAQQARTHTDPLDTPTLERFMLEKSGLLKVRPAITPALSGDPFVRVIPFQILSWAPRMVVFPAFVDPERCRIIIEYARASMHKSGLAYRPGEKADQAGQQTRTSSGTFMSSLHEPTGSLAWVEERIAAAAMIPVSHGEPFNILKYEHMQHYDSHMDSFDPKEYGAQSTQRVATVLVYLSDVEEGGETVFKREGRGNGSRQITEWRSCDDSVGYKYRPRMGDAVLFYDTRLNGDIDPHALHGGCPVKAGEKWVMTKWLRSKSMSYDTAAELELYGKQAKSNT